MSVFEWTSDGELKVECSHNDNVLALYLKCKGDFVLVSIVKYGFKISFIRGKACRARGEHVFQNLSNNELCTNFVKIKMFSYCFHVGGRSNAFYEVAALQTR